MHSWYDITLAKYVASFPLCKTSHPHFMTSNHRFYVITATIFDILSTVSVSSYPLYWWYHTNCISEITSAIVHNIISPLFLTKYPLSMPSQHSVLMSPHSAYVWHPLHCKWHRIHSITKNNAIYDVISTSRIASHPCIRHCTHCIFVITTSPLISHPLLNDITPTFCVTSYALYRTSHPIIMSSLYCTYDITTSIFESTFGM